MGSEPTEITTDGTKVWKNINGDLHREDGLAIIWKDGTQYWYKNDNRHREDGPAIIYPDGDKRWYIHGKRHREDGPAVIFPDGSQQWFINGNLHRGDGPAVINHNTQKSRYYIHGLDVTDRVLDWMKRDGLHGDLTPDDMRIFVFEFDITEKTL